TRFSRDWSSDVCSSDLGVVLYAQVVVARQKAACRGLECLQDTTGFRSFSAQLLLCAHPVSKGTKNELAVFEGLYERGRRAPRSEIGRASGRAGARRARE